MQEYTVTVNVDDENETCATVVASTDPNIAVGSGITLSDRYKANDWDIEIVLALTLENVTGFEYQPASNHSDGWITGDIKLSAITNVGQPAIRLGMEYIDENYILLNTNSFEDPYIEHLDDSTELPDHIAAIIGSSLGSAQRASSSMAFRIGLNDYIDSEYENGSIIEVPTITAPKVGAVS